jgi:outer membrane receptor protein involved in Fe transport
MMRNLLFTLGFILVANVFVFAQSGTLKGKVIDKETKEPIPFANVIVEMGGTQAGGTTSDFDGNYTIKPLTPGKYDIKATYIGYKPMLIRGFIIKSDQIGYQNIDLEATATTLETYEVVDYKVPLISKDQTASGATVTAEEISKMPSRSANAVATSVGGVFSSDGTNLNVRGQRSEGTVMYIDGIRVRGASSLPESAIEQVTVILGGVPAQYGDATGGIINVTTKGPSREFGAGLELQTSQFLDKFGYNRAGINMQGPLLWNKQHTTSLLGYFIAGEFEYNKDGRPTASGVYKAKDDVLASLEQTPLRPSGTGSGSYMNAEFIRKSDLELIKTTMNTSGTSANFSAKLDVKTGPSINLSFGGNYNYANNRQFSFANSLFNYKSNYQHIENTWRVFGRFTQRFPADKDSKSLIKNVYYTLQADYTKATSNDQDFNHKDDMFSYGYIGKFKTYKVRSYGQVQATDTILHLTGYLQDNFADTLYQFERAETNPILANYTSLYYSLYNTTLNHYDKLENVITGGGLLNGMGPDNVYSLWASPGSVQVGYYKDESEQFGFNGNASADIGNHAVQFGLIYEQRIDRSYNSPDPSKLWLKMRGETNSHIAQLDKLHPHPVIIDNVFQDTVNYDRIYDGANQYVFDKSLRKAIGLEETGTDWIDIDSYDINSYTIDYYDKDGNRKTAQLSKPLSIDMFSPDELFNNGDQIVNYYGYDYTGKKLKTKPSFDDYFNKKDASGNFTRELGAFEPIYMGGYISDKFSFDDLVFNVGLRVDRFDANQMVLKDPYLLYPAKTVSEETSLGTHPSSMGSDYVVYVDDASNPTKIMGYRNKDTWYNADGAVITDPKLFLDAGNGITPDLVHKDKKELSSEAFTDYNPQTSFMPRIAFSFPISDDALFFAHYDVLTQRPTSASRLDITDYQRIEIGGSPIVNNPNLKPERTVDYELGFQQKITNSSSLIMSSFYREIRDQIQFYRFTGAYPNEGYYSYNNIDFGTVKGLTVTYDMRQTGNVRIRAAYTLQFANGTGSDANASKALIQANKPNLRNLIPLNYDQRHALNLMIDYRYGEGKDYNGPMIKNFQLFKNTGFNITINGGSGTPYTKSSKIYSIISGSGQISGSINGSRLPWQFKLDGRIDRDLTLSTGKDKSGNPKNTFLNVYLQVLNILNAKNILNVYKATGNPDDDGYLAAADYQTLINAQLDSESFRELYALRINTPSNYSAPRLIRLGVSLNF